MRLMRSAAIGVIFAIIVLLGMFALIRFFDSQPASIMTTIQRASSSSSSSTASSTAPALSSAAAHSSEHSPSTASSSAPRSMQAAASSSARRSVLWGAYPGYTEQAVRSFVQLAGQEPDILATFVHWGNNEDFPSYLAATLPGKTLLIFWEAKDYNGHVTDQPAYSYEAILRGDHDAYIDRFRDDVRDYGGSVILVPFSEMNGDWSPWAGTKNGNTPELHIEAYRYLHDRFEGVTNVRFGWAVNNVSVPNVAGNGINAYYPGGAYVDIVGIDGFNFGDPWMTFDEIFSSALRVLSGYGKPIYLFSMASADGAEKAAWITDALTVQIPASRVQAWVWFHEDKERNWRIDSDAVSLGAFRSAIGSE